LIACASPLQRADALAERSGFSKEIVTGTTYRHVVYRHAVHRSGATLHVYIEGDGTPFRGRTVIADDPTPHDPLMLRLMAEDAAPSVYIGRPCYFGLHLDPGCGTEAWTSRRFAPEILESMSSVVESERVRAGASRLALFGHSGGGALAVLLAVRQPSVVRVVTIGATLDIGAWCRLHGYTPLAGSLNPVLAPMQRKGVEVLHWVGENDTNTPPSLIGMAARTRGEPVRVVAGFDHHCCWRRMWHDILATAGNPASD
jgi:pimeloyl-ACP methyl ester carboxylesterase